MESMYASLEEDNKSKDNVYMKSGDVVREFPRSRLYLKDILCEGRFSKTMTGEAWFIGGKDGVSDVIVTVAKGDKGDFKREVEVMGSLSKLKGVVKYLGCCITEDPMYMITEYAKGNLLQVLEKMKDADALKRKGPDLLTFALDVAECLQTLSDKKIIHREVMAKNIVVDSQWKCKLSGLGSSSAVLTDQRYRQKGHLPIRWMAPEVLSGNAYTTGSDVWSFGVLLWEVYSLGCIPYESLLEDDVIDFIRGGKRLDIPPGCAETPYQIMTSCWIEIPDERTQVDDLVSSLRQFQAEGGK
ncbi:tyrosine kinase receptor Cad96Ca-like [Ptychodera flava]|uniref:tyrosine kinase receptor Cad96Ca-like n=1 Tax=Ptychodera flava TaxID=63121 RepID=UPI003969D817